MSLQFIFGNSGSGKSDFLYDSVLKQAKENKEQQFLIIVPEQFTKHFQLCFFLFCHLARL